MKPETFTLVCEERHGKKRLALTAPARYDKLVDSLGIGEEVQMRLSQQRDLKHNSKIHAVIGEAAEALGWEDPTEFKEKLLERLRPDVEDPVTGFMRRKKTSEMSNEEIDQLVTEIKAFVQHLMPGYVFEFDQGVAA